MPFFEHGGVPEIEIGPLQKNLREARFHAGRTGQLTASAVHMKHVHRCSRFAKKWRQVYLFMILCTTTYSYMCPCKTPSHDQPLFNCTVLVLINEVQNWTLDTA